MTDAAPADGRLSLVLAALAALLVGYVIWGLLTAADRERELPHPARVRAAVMRTVPGADVRVRDAIRPKPLLVTVIGAHDPQQREEATRSVIAMTAVPESQDVMLRFEKCEPNEETGAKGAPFVEVLVQRGRIVAADDVSAR